MTWVLDLSESLSDLLSDILLGLASLGLFIGTTAMVIIGLRKARRSDVCFETLRMPVLGIALCFCIAFSAWYFDRDLKQQLKMIQEHSQAIIKSPVPYEGIDPKLHSRLSKLAAAARFLYLGSITEYTSPNGEAKMYEPTNEDRQLSRRIEKTREFLESGSSALRGIMYAWIACGLTSTLLGIFLPITTKISKQHLTFKD